MPDGAQPLADPATRPAVAAPMALLAELTHRCPLACPYCSNPTELVARGAELDTATWLRVFREAAALGVLQLHLSGGEPASRRDLEELVAGARAAGLYVNLITSGIGLPEARLDRLVEAGVDHVQLSLQGVNAGMSDFVGHYPGGFERKMALAGWVVARGLPLTLNAVMHRLNLDDLPATIDLAVALVARRMEVACVQFYGWGLANRAALMPTRDQTDRAKAVVAAARERLKGTLVIDFVPPDYHSDYPKSCMGGWATTGLNVAPDGTVLPCHAAQTIPGVTFPNVRTEGLAAIWRDSAAFNLFRGEAWMPEPCRSCERRAIDQGGCRCQALALLGDAGLPDPVCRKTAGRAVVDAMLAAETGPVASDAPAAPDIVWRANPL